MLDKINPTVLCKLVEGLSFNHLGLVALSSTSGSNSCYRLQTGTSKSAEIIQQKIELIPLNLRCTQYGFCWVVQVFVTWVKMVCGQAVNAKMWTVKGSRYVAKKCGQ